MNKKDFVALKSSLQDAVAYLNGDKIPGPRHRHRALGARLQEAIDAGSRENYFPVIAKHVAKSSS